MRDMFARVTPSGVRNGEGFPNSRHLTGGALSSGHAADAHDDLETRLRTVLFLLVGLPGAGKTTKARQLESQFQAIRLTPDEWMIPLFGESESGGKRDVLEGRLIWVALRALQVGTSVVLDFGFWGRDERSALRAMAATLGVESKVVYLPIDQQTQLQRINRRYELTPEHTFEITPRDLATFEEQFEVPDASELDGSRLDPPPVGCPTWSSWAAGRWPSLPVL
jgi:predicted kinase